MFKQVEMVSAEDLLTYQKAHISDSYRDGGLVVLHIWPSCHAHHTHTHTDSVQK